MGMQEKRLDIHNSEIPLVCQSCEARHKGICGALQPDQLLHLAKHTNRTNHTPDTELLASGEDTLHSSKLTKDYVTLTT